MYARILVAVDGSPTSDRALAEALTLAKEQRAALRIVHVIDTLPPIAGLETMDISGLQKALRDAGEQVLERAQTQAAAAGVPVDSRLIDLATAGTRIAALVCAEARSWPADLIVLGTHGRRGLDHLLLGSVAEGVVRIAPSPVLLIRGR